MVNMSAALLAAVLLASGTILANQAGSPWWSILPIFGSGLVLLGATIWGLGHWEHLLFPKLRRYRRLVETCSQLVREVADPELLLGQIASQLYTTLQPEHVSIWRYRAADHVLVLSTSAGPVDSTNLAELPVDLDPAQLTGLRPLAALPESALRQGFVALQVQRIVSLSLGDELIGIIGLGQSRDRLDDEPEAARWLNLIAGQLALVIKNSYLTADSLATRQKLQQAYRRVIDTQEEERRKLASELHDEILGQLTLMRFTLRDSQKFLSSDSARVRNWLETLEHETQSINHRLREITQGLHPSVLTNLGLISALGAYLDSLSKQQPGAFLTAPVITLTAQGFTQRIANQKLECDLYYIIRQALDNALLHAQAEQISIHLRWREATIAVTVQDTGQGMKADPEQLMGQDGHLGLLSIHERVLAWQGRLDFYSAVGQGTTLYIRLPVGQPSREPTHLQTFTHYLAKTVTAQPPCHSEAEGRKIPGAVL
jgi:signal transduction histidine kinase